MSNTFTFEELKKAALEEAKSKIHTVYGHYQSGSGQMFFEMYHGKDGGTRYKRGEYGKPLLEDRELTLEQAVIEFSHAMQLGYDLLFKGVTESDMDKGNQKRIEALSQAQRDDILGTYRLGDKFVRLSQYGETFTIETGTNDNIETANCNQPETEARKVLDLALTQGFSKLANNHTPTEVSIEDLFEDF